MPDEPEAEEPRRDEDLFDALGGSDGSNVPAPEPAEEPAAPAAAEHSEPVAPEPEEEPPSETPAEGAAEPEGAGPEGGAEPPSGELVPATGGDGKRRAKWPWIILGVLLGLLVLVGWTKAVNANSFCTRCHSMQAAADTATHSAHQDVPCISCHRGVGIGGAVAYIPTLFRETVDQLTPLHSASGTMDAAPCSKCHNTIFTSPVLKGEHPSSGCPECHGNSSHPAPVVQVESTTSPHPSTWIQLHGRAATEDPQSCTTCHSPGSCMTTCHSLSTCCNSFNFPGIVSAKSCLLSNSL